MPIRAILNRFMENRNGTVAILVCVVVLPILLGILMFSIDAPKVQDAALANKGGLDASAIGTAEFILRGKFERRVTDPVNWTKWKPSQSELYEYSRKLYEANFKTDQNAFTIIPDSFEVTYEGSKIRVKSCLTTKNNFTFSVGAAQNSIVCEASEADVSVDSSNAFVMSAFSLDATASMRDKVGGKRKIDQMETVMKNLITKYFSDGSAVYASITPFTTLPEVYPYEVEILNDGVSKHYEVSDTNLDSTLPRTGLVAPRFEKLDKYTHSKTTKLPIIGLSVQPFTNSATLLTAYIDEFAANVGDEDKVKKQGGTAGISGIYNAWLTLSPAYYTAWNSRKSDFEDRKILAKNRPSEAEMAAASKFILHITDGIDNNNEPYGVFGSTGSSARKDLYKDICGRIKQQKVQIYIIVYGEDAEDYHKECVAGQTGSVPFLYENVSPDELATALEQIFATQFSKILAPKLVK